MDNQGDYGLLFSAGCYPANMDYDSGFFSAALPTVPALAPSAILQFPGDHFHGVFGSGGGGASLQQDPLGFMGGGPGDVLHAELMGKMSAQEVMDAKAQAACRSHSEAERRRRERINAHLARLRSLLPNTTKTDKASLLAEVIQHVKELKRQTSELADENPLPTEADELTVDTEDNNEGRLIVKASLCCEDRSDLIPDLVKALKALRLRTLKAEITTLGGRVKNILLVTAEDECESNQQLVSISAIQDALRAVVERGGADEVPRTAGGIKRQRTNIMSSALF